MFVSTPTQAEFRTTLSNRLGDPHNVRWTVAELNLLINEAIRTWNSGAFYHRARGLITTVVGEPFYDLTSLLDDGAGNKILDMTATAQDACAAIEYSFLETPTSDFTVTWSGTEQFSFADISSAIEKRRNQFLVETGQVVTVADLIPITSGNGRTILDDSFIDVRRVAWKSLDNTFTNLWQVDEITLNRRLVGWNRNQATPQSFSLVTTPETIVQLGPAPVDSGNLHVLIQLARLMASTLQVLVGDEDVPVQSIDRLDIARPNWQHTSASSGATGAELVAQAGPNLIAIYKVPSIVYTFTVDVVRNAIVPSQDDHHIQIGDEYLGSLLGYCVHLAMFKEGGADFVSTMPLYQNFFRAASGFNAKLQANAKNFPVLYKKAQVEREEMAA